MIEFGKILNWTMTDNVLSVEFEKNNMTISVLTDEIINVFVPLWAKEHYSKAVEESDLERVLRKGRSANAVFNSEKSCIELSTAKIKAVICDGGYVDFYDLSGKEISKAYRGERVSRRTIGKFDMELLAAEGHDTTGLLNVQRPVEDVRVVDSDEPIYGLGDKSGFLNKRSYEYENWNTDDPSAHTEQFRSLYKSIPFAICKKPEYAYGLFYDNTFHSYFDLAKENASYMAYSADDGNLDLYFIGGGNIPAVVGNYTLLTGRAPLPQLWTLGYHQCRWGYSNAKDITEVAEKLRELDIPCESVQYDIDYMDGYRVFTWNEKDYGPAGELFEKLRLKGFKPVVIIDPGTKREEGYFMYEEGTKNGYFFRNADDTEDYVNAVWPGDSNYPDFGRKAVRDWWGEHVNSLTDMGVMGIWNDMNEPASFKGPLPEDVIGYDEDRKTTHRELHNVYGHYMSKATYDAMKAHTGKRPLVITRACYSGSQKYTAVWTGDNQSLWSHLQMMIPQLCSLGMCGFPIAGVDIGGFGGDTTPELLCRWIEAAAFSTFFRNHSANGCIRQEPWQFGTEVVDIYRKFVKLHYRFLPYIYDLMHEEQENGLPVMRPLVMHYEDDPVARDLNDEYLVGEKILVAPVVNQGEKVRKVYLPEGTWYSLWTGEKHEGRRYFLEEAPLDHMPVYIKAGSVIPVYEEMQYVGEKPLDKLTLITAPGGGSFVHYQDGGEDLSYLEGNYNLYRFSVDENKDLTAELLNEAKTVPQYEKIRVVSI